MVIADNIKKSFGSLEVLKGINLHIEKGEVVSIVGASGAGKTTLLQIVGSLDKPTSGKVFIDGTDLGQLSEKKQAYWFRIPISSVAARIHGTRERNASSTYRREK